MDKPRDGRSPVLADDTQDIKARILEMQAALLARATEALEAFRSTGGADPKLIRKALEAVDALAAGADAPRKLEHGNGHGDASELQLSASAS